MIDTESEPAQPEEPTYAELTPGYRQAIKDAAALLDITPDATGETVVQHLLRLQGRRDQNLWKNRVHAFHYGNGGAIPAPLKED